MFERDLVVKLIEGKGKGGLKFLLGNGWKGVRHTVTLRYKGGRGGPKILSKSALRNG